MKSEKPDLFQPKKRLYIKSRKRGHNQTMKPVFIAEKHTNPNKHPKLNFCALKPINAIDIEK